MTFEEMQNKFITPDQDQYTWYCVGFNQAKTKQEVNEIVSNIDSEYKFVHKNKSLYFIGLDSGIELPEDFSDFLILVDAPIVEEG